MSGRIHHKHCRVDSNKPLTFTFDGTTYRGFAGDTLASALLANGVKIVARSFKYGRPRGIIGAGAEEPNALVQIDIGARTTPDLKATQVELYDGLVAARTSGWPSLAFDLKSIGGKFARFMPAGFYYKTFKWQLSFGRCTKTSSAALRAMANRRLSLILKPMTTNIIMWIYWWWALVQMA